MRPWRKLHAGIITSDRLSQVSDSAALLFDLLVVAQDDEGKYPWTPAKIKALTVSRSWTPSKANAFAAELQTAGLINFLQEEGKTSFAIILGGAEKNGRPAGYRDLFVYEASDEVHKGSVQTPREVHKGSVPDKRRLDEIREEEDERESSPAAATRPKGKFDQEWAKGYADSQKTGWNEAETNRQITMFLGNHEAKGWKNISDQNGSWIYWVAHRDDFQHSGNVRQIRNRSPERNAGVASQEEIDAMNREIWGDAGKPPGAIPA